MYSVMIERTFGEGRKLQLILLFTFAFIPTWFPIQNCFFVFPSKTVSLSQISLIVHWTYLAVLCTGNGSQSLWEPFYDVMKVSETAIMPWLSPGLSMLHYAITTCSNGLQRKCFLVVSWEKDLRQYHSDFFLSCDISKRELDRSLLLLPRAIAKIFPWMKISVVSNNI